jgi:hypothetical protein
VSPISVEGALKSGLHLSIAQNLEEESPFTAVYLVQMLNPMLKPYKMHFIA